MANDLYSIPFSDATAGHLREPAPVFANPELLAGPYQGIKAIESHVFSYRDAALVTEKRPRTWLGGLVFSPSHPTMRELVQKESQLGGALFGHGHAFWLDVESAAGRYPGEVADWYHMQPNPADPKNPIVLRFQTTPQKIHKLYDGREYEPTVQDLEIFVQAVEAYAQAILPLYPLDQAIDDLRREEDDRSDQSTSAA